MKKLILIIFLVTAISVFAQAEKAGGYSYTTEEYNFVFQISEDTCVKYVGRLEGTRWICTDTIYFLCDTVKGSGSAGGEQDSISAEQKEIQSLLAEFKKVEEQIKQLEQAREQIRGIILYLSKKYNIKVE